LTTFNVQLPEDLWLVLAHRAVDLGGTPDQLATEILRFMLQPMIVGGGPAPPDTESLAWVRSNRYSGVVRLDCALPKTIQKLLPIATISAQPKPHP
jgi:hypothetical protein